MKANKLKYIALSGAFMLLTAFATISCDDANDWTTDSSYNRLFSVPKMSVSANATDAELTWSTTPGTEYYIIEISLDSLYDDVAMGKDQLYTAKTNLSLNLPTLWKVYTVTASILFV